ncbi:carbon-nitrogen hydrolase [Teratosphaeria nubilosa]|uniref:Carbon-nitrogen hydrolase n=1 Tax=Teratosphaeria nubilosa TaxID=161662 RepID=A0A6G1L0Z2_9PEZI|nr:carbon-nitrogen hydrolase [Teratosphaeria nubilosa]
MAMERNYARSEEFIRAASRQHAQLAVLPEYHLLNWVPHDETFKEACSHWETYLHKYRALAKECNINIVPGTIVELHDKGTEDERLLNVAYFITNTGEIAGKYVKKNLWGPIERLHLTSSSMDEHPVFDTPLGKVGMLICWDLAFPEAFREMIAKGAKLFIIPTFWTLNDCSPAGLAINPVAEGLFLDSMLTARCFENTCAIVFANAGGPPGKGYAGLSQVCVPYAGALTRLGSSAEGMAVVDLDMGIVEDAEANYQVRADLARTDWHYEYRHTEKDDSKL